MEAAAGQSAQQYSVVVDTCSFARPLKKGDSHHDAYLQAADVQLLLGNALPAGHTVCVPDVVVLEMVKHFREDLKAAVHDVNRCLGRAGEVLRLSVGLRAELVDLDAAGARYEQWLRQYLVQHRRCLILQIPAAARDGLQLIKRDLDGRRPFSEGGRGMRDTVLWLSVLELLGTSISTVALITANTKDFCKDKDSPGQLHDDLLADLASCGWAERVQHFASIGAFASVHIEPMTQQLEDMRTALSRRMWSEFDLYDWLQRAAGPVLLSGAEPSLPGFLRGARPDVTDVKVVDALQLGSIYRVSPEAFYLQGTAKLAATAHLNLQPGALGVYTAAIPEPTLPQETHVLRRPSPVYVLPRINRELGDLAEVSLWATVEFSLVLGANGSTDGALIEVVDPQ